MAKTSFIVFIHSDRSVCEKSCVQFQPDRHQPLPSQQTQPGQPSQSTDSSKDGLFDAGTSSSSSTTQSTSTSLGRDAQVLADAISEAVKSRLHKQHLSSQPQPQSQEQSSDKQHQTLDEEQKQTHNQEQQTYEQEPEHEQSQDSSTTSLSSRVLRVGYLSYDWRNHPMGRLTKVLVTHHNLSRVLPVAISYGPDDKVTRARLNFPINTSYQHTLSIHSVNIPYQHTISTHPIIPPF